MNPYKQKRQEILFWTFDKFPKLSNQGTAKYLVKYYPEFFKSVEVARSIVRFYRGSCGEKGRREIANKKYLHERMA